MYQMYTVIFFYRVAEILPMSHDGPQCFVPVEKLFVHEREPDRKPIGDICETIEKVVKSPPDAAILLSTDYATNQSWV